MRAQSKHFHDGASPVESHSLTCEARAVLVGLQALHRTRT